MAGRWKPYVNGPGAIQQPDYSPNDADREWVARELGDVPYRVGKFQGIQIECGPNFAPPDPLDYVPVESLGRDSDG